jgi:hypothetical protein
MLLALLAAMLTFPAKSDLYFAAPNGRDGAGSDDTWIHVAMIYDGETVRLFINGEQRDEASASASVLSSNDINIGRYLDGILDEVRIYDTALTQAQINNLYIATNARAKW